MHYFDIEIAEKYDIQCAIMLNHIIYWISKNSSKNRNYYDERTWTYSSISDFKEYFTYWTDSQIRGIIKKMLKYELIIENNYNKIKYDRTKWYALKDEEHWLKHYNPIDKIDNWKS